MPHIAFPEGLPGISSGFAFRPETAKPMRELAQILLRDPTRSRPASARSLRLSSLRKTTATSARPAMEPPPHAISAEATRGR